MEARQRGNLGASLLRILAAAACVSSAASSSAVAAVLWSRVTPVHVPIPAIAGGDLPWHWLAAGVACLRCETSLPISMRAPLSIMPAHLQGAREWRNSSLAIAFVSMEFHALPTYLEAPCAWPVGEAVMSPCLLELFGSHSPCPKGHV